MNRRDVRVSAQFFEDLDRQLGMERGPNGEPSVIDFQTIELLEIVEWFATRFDELPPAFDGREDYRVLVKSVSLGCVGPLELTLAAFRNFNNQHQ